LIDANEDLHCGNFIFQIYILFKQGLYHSILSDLVPSKYFPPNNKILESLSNTHENFVLGFDTYLISVHKELLTSYF